jgi:hypothetical protein
MKAILFSLLLVTGFLGKEPSNAKGFDRQAFYNAIKSGSVKAIDEQIAAVQSSGLKDKDAFEGTLLMKKGRADKGGQKQT